MNEGRSREAGSDVGSVSCSFSDGNFSRWWVVES